ncbi:MAG: hypothetical protein LQ338_006104 [Usnochroma carphineum]|nr:MAG: hypothetical protein LQ338_006104 [Usnochroma carphineum]
MAAPAASPPRAYELTQSSSQSTPTSLLPTSTTSDACMSTITPAAGQKRGEGNIWDLEALAFPQMISSTPCSKSNPASSTFEFEVAHQARSTGKPAKLAPKNFGRAVTNEVEHNIPNNEPAPQHTRRPDLSTFFSNLELVNTSNTQNSNATPMPADMRAVFITLSDAFRSMRQDGGGNLLDALIETLEADAESPPKEVKGVSDAFLDDQYPLVVRLPCHKDHIFDLECIAPWLKLHATCPMDRKNLLKKKEPSPPSKDEEEEEDGEYDEMFA